MTVLEVFTVTFEMLQNKHVKLTLALILKNL